MMKLVEQRRYGDCVIATTATWFRKSYEEMEQVISGEMGVPPHKGSSPYHVLRHLGYRPTVSNCLRRLPCFVSIRSKNYPKTSHSIILDINEFGDIQILDPSHMEKYEDLQDVYDKMYTTVYVP